MTYDKLKAIKERILESLYDMGYERDDAWNRGYKSAMRQVLAWIDGVRLRDKGTEDLCRGWMRSQYIPATRRAWVIMTNHEWVGCGSVRGAVLYGSSEGTT